MATKNDVEVIISGKVYHLSGYESQEYLQKVAMYMNNKIHSFEAMEGYSRLNQDMKQLLLDINIADDYFKAKQHSDFLEADLTQRDKQLYDVKEELVSEQMKNEELEFQILELKEELEKAQKELAQVSEGQYGMG